MRLPVIGLIAIILGSLAFGCKKDNKGDDSDLYGVWAKGSNIGDTIWFMKKNGQSIMRLSESTNPSMPAYAEKEFRLRNGVLFIKSFAPFSQEYDPITSFTWTDPRKEFTILNTELYLLMSSMITYKYRKI
jgi:hypothetical protein